MDGDLKVLVVTGGSGGIGLATAGLASKRGFAVAIGFKSDRDSAQRAAESIRTQGGRAQAFPVDVADPHSVDAFFNSVDKNMGRLSALVNSAGITGGNRKIQDLDPETIKQVVAVNLLGTFYCVRAAVERMSPAKGGTGGVIVNVSSEAARFGGNRLSAYAAAKAGVNTMTVGLARELAEENIRVNAVCPGVIDTEQHAGLSEERRQALLGSIPLKRMGEPEEVAEAILWLLSDASSYVTGSVLSVNGGR